MREQIEHEPRKEAFGIHRRSHQKLEWKHATDRVNNASTAGDPSRSETKQQHGHRRSERDQQRPGRARRRGATAAVVVVGAAGDRAGVVRGRDRGRVRVRGRVRGRRLS